MSMRAAAKSVTISHGLLSMTGDLYTTRVTADERDGGSNTRFTSCCPVDASNGTAIPLQTRYVCPDHPDHGPFEYADVVKGVERDGALHLIGTVEEVNAARAPARPEGEKPFLEPHSHLASDLARCTVMGASSHVFRPSGRNDLYGVLASIIGQDGRIACEDGQDRVLIGSITLRSEKLAMLRMWGEELVLQEIDWPSNLKYFEPLVHTVENEAFIPLARNLVQESCETFVADSYRNEAKANLGEFVAARIADPTSIEAPLAIPTSSGGGDLMAALQASIDAAKAARAPAEAPKRTRKPAAPKVTPIRKAS